HPVEISGMLAKKPENRSAEQLKERHVIIEHIPILDEPVCPGPNDMQMLRFIAVESEKEDIPELEESPQAEEACSDPNLRPAGQAEIVLKPANRPVYGRLRSHHIALNHPSAKKARLNQVAPINTLDIDEGCFLPSELEHPASLKKEIRSRARAWRARQFPVSIFFNRRGSDAASCCRTRCNRHNRDCNGVSIDRKDCIAAVSGRPHERGQYDSLFL